jgi:PII-like signaling protein
MNINGKCRIMKVYVSEDSKYKGHSLYHAVVLELKKLDIAGVTVMRGIEGYGQGKRISTARILELSSSLPIVIEAIDKPERIDRALPVIEEMVDEGLVMVTDVDVVKYGKNLSK